MVRKISPSKPTELKYTLRDDDDNVVDEYILNIPKGPLGWKHFLMLMELENARKETITEWRKDTRQFITIVKEDPKTEEWKEITIENPTYNQDIQVDLPNPKLDSVMQNVMNKWVLEILPEILISHKFEDLEWYLILPLFEMACKNASVDTINFRSNK